MIPVKVSVVIVNYNVRPFLENALVAVTKALKGIRSETIVVDNASDDGSVAMVRKRFPRVKLIANDRNLGFAVANNRGVKEAKGEFLLFLNPDTVVQEDTVRVMTEYFKGNPDVGLAGCKILNPDGTLQLACRRSFPTPWVAFTKMVGLAALFPTSPLFARYNLTYLSSEETYDVDAVSGSFMFIRRRVFEEVGGFDQQFFMYGEDLDLCYRVKKSGWKISYVHSTQMIHFKGESVRRSDVDDVRLFYEAMRIFVRKHVPRRGLSDAILYSGIAMREWAAFFGRIARPLGAAVLDLMLVVASLFIAAWARFGDPFRFPAYAYPVITTVPPLVLFGTLYSMGVYSTRKLSVARAVGSVAIGYTILSALTFFFNQYAFSRLLVLIAGGISVVLLPAWRLVSRARTRSSAEHGATLFGRDTLIVGADASGQEVLRKLRTRIDGGYNVVGFVDVNRRRIGDKIAGVEILGSIDNISKVIQERKVSEVIFSTNTLSYSDILSVIERAKSRSVNFRLVPNTLDVIIGKTHIDELNDIPLVDIEYNIHKLQHRIVKRSFDVAASVALLGILSPVALFRRRTPGRTDGFWKKVAMLPNVFRGEMSLVGLSHPLSPESRNGSAAVHRYSGKTGITGLAQLHEREGLTPEDVERYNLYYAKNQSLLLDLQILLRSALRTSIR